MGDSHEVKCTGEYKQWSQPEHKMLLRLLVDAINQGFRDANGTFNKLTVETRILSTLKQKLGSTKTYNQYRNQMKTLKSKYQSWIDLFRFSSGFGWDPETKKFTATNEVWDEYLKAHPGNTHLRNESYEDFDDLRTMFGQSVATGQNAMGLGDTIDMHTNQVEDTYGMNDNTFVEILDDAKGVAYQQEQASENVVVSSFEKSMGQNYHQRKKARSDRYDKVCDELNAMTELNNQILGVIQKRWEKEAEEKETEDKANNVWDAIKEIPDLDEDLRYEAMTLVHSLGIKFGFMNMSVAERCGWIKRNLRKPSV